MKLEQANRLYRTYKSHRELSIMADTFVETCESFIQALKQVRKMLADRDEKIKKLQKENRELKKDRDFYREISMKGGE